MICRSPACPLGDSCDDLGRCRIPDLVERDPDRRGGRPIVVGTSTPTYLVADAVIAEGDAFAAAEVYRLTLDQVLAADAFERRTRRRWARALYHVADVLDDLGTPIFADQVARLAFVVGDVAP